MTFSKQQSSFKSRAYTQFKRIAAWLSQGINVLCLGGHHDQTVSARCWVNRGHKGWSSFGYILDMILGEHHCYNSHQRDVEFSKEVLDGRL